jgi:hypothetical protein
MTLPRGVSMPVPRNNLDEVEIHTSTHPTDLLAARLWVVLNTGQGFTGTFLGSNEHGDVVLANVTQQSVAVNRAGPGRDVCVAVATPTSTSPLARRTDCCYEDTVSCIWSLTHGPSPRR